MDTNHVQAYTRHYRHGIKRFLCLLMYKSHVQVHKQTALTRYKTFSMSINAIQVTSKYITDSYWHGIKRFLCLWMYTMHDKVHNRQYWPGIKRFLCLSMYTMHVKVHNRQYWHGIKRFLCISMDTSHAQVHNRQYLTRYKTFSMSINVYKSKYQVHNSFLCIQCLHGIKRFL